MKIYLVRHGEALSSEADPQRPLSQKGKEEVQRVADFIVRAGISVHSVMHSPKLRAEQTAEIFAKALKTDLTVCPSILDSEAEILPLLSIILSLNMDTMLVGHMPMLAKLVSELVIHDENLIPINNYRPGTVVCLENYEDGRWVINWILPPQLLP